MMRIVN